MISFPYIKNRIYLIALILFLVFVFTLIFFQNRNLGFKKSIKECGQDSVELRFSCFRFAMEEHFGQNPSEFLNVIRTDLLFKKMPVRDNDRFSYAVFGTNCHNYYHAAGDFIATYFPNSDLKTLIESGPIECANGFVMGLYKRLALAKAYDSEFIQRFFDACNNDIRQQCSHELGHILYDKYISSVLEKVDSISKEVYGLNYPVYDYSFSEETDFEGSYRECKKLLYDEDELQQCFVGIGHNLFLFSEFSAEGYKSALEECSRLENENSENCYRFVVYRIGINEVTPKFLSGNFSGGLKICRDIADLTFQEKVKGSCYLGLGGGLGLYAESSLTAVNSDDEDLSLIKENLAGYPLLCEKVDEKFIETCINGLMATRYKKMYDQYGIFNQKVEDLKSKGSFNLETLN